MKPKPAPRPAAAKAPAKAPATASVTLRVSREHLDKLDEIARQLGMNRSPVIQLAIAELIERRAKT